MMFNNFQLRDECRGAFEYIPKLSDQEKYDLLQWFNGVNNLNQILNWLSEHNLDREGKFIKKYGYTISDHNHHDFIKRAIAYQVFQLINEAMTLEK